MLVLVENAAEAVASYNLAVSRHVRIRHRQRAQRRAFAMP
jgi:hypothetical protein